MQRLTVIALLLLLVSCKSKEDNPAPTPERWVLFDKKIYDYKLNSLGSADTVYIMNYKYKDGLLNDSSVSFVVYKYNYKNALTDEISYQIDSSRKVVEGLTKKYNFNAKGVLVGSSVFYDNKLDRSETSYYNDSNVLTRQVVIAAKIDTNANKANFASTTASSNSSVRYDTTIMVYKYDETKKLVGLTYSDPRGKIVRNDANVYSGSDPLFSHSTSPSGDTLQKVTYEKSGKIMHISIENDTLMVIQNVQNGFQVGQMTIDKKKKEKWRSAVSYDPTSGRPKEETLYKAI